ncbi:nucleoside hydrolase [Parafilimonas sp.]|uniref:nucleoside hydrolase n=1 Tax=Parafilimonas sp. TaxID=1969739 RepID=UPI0039E37EF2
MKNFMPVCIMQNTSALIVSLLLSCSLYAQPVQVIFDSDMGPDYDDVGAIALLHAFADEGKANILATIASTKYTDVAVVFSVFNTYFKRPDIPIAVPKGEAPDLRDFQHWSDSIVKNYPHAVNSNRDVPDAVALYRRVLAIQPNNSVTIITVGFLTNLKNLLQSKADMFSPLSGEQLVKQKVKQLVSMAGRFPAGSEFNINKDFVAAKYVFDHFPAPVLFSGFEIGEKIKCGIPLIQNDSIEQSPVKDVFRISIPQAKEDSAGRKSWDETAVLVGVKGYKDWYTVQQGKIIISDKDGSNTWMDDKTSKQYHLVEKAQPAVVQELIDRLIMYKPGKEE